MQGATQPKLRASQTRLASTCLHKILINNIVFFVVWAVLVSLAVNADSQRPTISNFQEKINRSWWKFNMPREKLRSQICNYHPGYVCFWWSWLKLSLPIAWQNDGSGRGTWNKNTLRYTVPILFVGHRSVIKALNFATWKHENATNAQIAYITRYKFWHSVNAISYVSTCCSIATISCVTVWHRTVTVSYQINSIQTEICSYNR